MCLQENELLRSTIDEAAQAIADLEGGLLAAGARATLLRAACHPPQRMHACKVANVGVAVPDVDTALAVAPRTCPEDYWSPSVEVPPGQVLWGAGCSDGGRWGDC